MVNFKSDFTEEICDILKCPKGYLSKLSQTSQIDEAEELVLFCHWDWIQQINKEKCIPDEFLLHSSLSEKEIEALVADRQLGPSQQDWCFLTLRLIPRDFIPSSFKTIQKRDRGRQINPKSTLPEILQNINDNFLERSWKVCRSDNNKDICTNSPGSLETTWEEDILHFVSSFSSQETPILYNTEQCPQHNTKMIKSSSSSEAGAGLTRLLCLVFTDKAAILIMKYHPVSVTQMIKFSPAVLLDINLKYLFVFYQILRIYEELHAKEIYLGQNVHLSQFKITENLHVQFEPKFTLQKRKKIKSSTSINVDSYIEKLNLSKKAEDCPFLGEATTNWCNGELSNLDYLLVLNHAAGRRFGQPNNHPVVPWVCDFSTKEGGERDLSRSKFRLNKGDATLDLNYESGAHHVTDVLSEITYYTYKSRITDREVLCRYVRPNWVPAEYPSSMKRMMSWSPDEAIPEFYTDPRIFSSIHSDLPELELPEWTRTAEEFCDWHRARLESPSVSAQLHSWIDLTFGYKLSGSAAIRNKNVSLSISDSHTDLRRHGVLQLFSLPHPVKVNKSKMAGIPLSCLQSQISEGNDDYVESEDDEGNNESKHNQSGDSQTKIVLPDDFDPMAELMKLEAVHSFQTKTGALNYQTLATGDQTSDSFISEDYALLRDDLRVLGCLLVELFLHKKCLTLQPNSCFEIRFKFAKQHMKTLPTNLRNLGDILFDLAEDYCENLFFPPPPASVSKLTHPLTSIAHFPDSFGPINRMLGLTADMEERRDECFGEFCVTVIARTLSPLLSFMTPECLELVVPLMQQLLQSADKTAVLAAWLLFDNFSSALGNVKTNAKFLERMNTLYMNGTTTAKHAKLYHRTFLLSLIVRFKMRSFLGHFIHPLIEAVGGYKDLEWDCDRRGLDDTIINDKKEDIQGGGGSVTSQLSNNIVKIQSGDAFSDGEVFAFDGMEDGDNVSKHSDVDIDTLEIVTQNLSRTRHISNESLNGIIDLASMTRVTENAEDRRQEDTNISSVASESVMWLAQRLGPVLACRHLSRNLLRMLALCYAGPEGVRDTGRPHRDQKIRVSGARVEGDLTAEPVLECLSQLVGLYGDSLVVVQYLPHCWDLVSRAKRRISASLESCLLAAAAVTHTSIPLLSDSVLMNELPHSILAHVLAPVLQVTTSRRVMFMSGPRARLVLLYKILDALYIIGLRIGEEMARIHLTPLATGFFSALDKLEVIEGGEADGSDDNGTLAQLKQVLTPATVFAAYVCFNQLLGGAHLEACLSNGDLVKRLLKVYHHSSALLRPVHRPASFLELQGLPSTGQFSSTSYGGSGQSGNMIVVSQESGDNEENSNDFHMINKPAVDSGRHLRGNWLAYWEHELGKDGRDNSFNFKQIKLQSFTGHVGGVKSLHVLDNENSFLSGGRDKVVRLWSVRNTGEGDTQVASQSLFTGHKRSVFYVSFLSGPGHAVSCDGGLVVWDPWVMTTVAEYECPGAKTSFCAARTISDPGHVILAATSDGTVRLLDTRDKQRPGCELRVSQGAAGLIRSLAVNRDGHQIAVGHSSGYISMLDIRTGRLKTGFKAHDGEVLTLTDVNKHFVSTSLDQLASGWRWEDGRQAASLRAFPEPLHCVASYEDSEVIMGSTANRLIFQRSVETDSPSTVHKLKGDLIKGNLSQMAVLPLNKQLLLASDAGNIYLVC